MWSGWEAWQWTCSGLAVRGDLCVWGALRWMTCKASVVNIVIVISCRVCPTPSLR